MIGQGAKPARLTIVNPKVPRNTDSQNEGTCGVFPEASAREAMLGGRVEIAASGGRMFRNLSSQTAARNVTFGLLSRIRRLHQSTVSAPQTEAPNQRTRPDPKTTVPLKTMNQKKKCQEASIHGDRLLNPAESAHHHEVSASHNIPNR